MDLAMKEIILLVRDCEMNKGTREAERIRQERECYRNIRDVVEPFLQGKEEKYVREKFKGGGIR